MSPNLPQLFLEAITAYFVEFGPVSEKTSDNLRWELEFHNNWRFDDYPGLETEEVTLVQLLQASTEKLTSSGEDAVQAHIHRLIEDAFLEQEMLRSIETLWPQTQSNDVTLAHVALIEAAVSSHLSTRGTQVLQEFSERVRQHRKDDASLAR